MAYTVYIVKSELTAALELAKPGLMRTLIGIFYSTERLATSSATKGINPQINNAINDLSLMMSA